MGFGSVSTLATTPGVRAQSDKGVQYLAVRYAQRLAEAGAVASSRVHRRLDDNALAEAFNSLFKAELFRNKRSLCDVPRSRLGAALVSDVVARCPRGDIDHLGRAVPALDRSRSEADSPTVGRRVRRPNAEVMDSPNPASTQS